ncbi:MAG: hypothetical protein JXA20_06950 [Spirochaetes bacterium]|nr:hypothetical protein [Spirochaetota bacterium]
MKKTALTLLILFTAATARADRILLRDMTVLEGTVIRITERAVEYDPAGDTPYGSVPRERVCSVRYNDGRVQAVSVDSVELTDGSLRRGVIRELRPEGILFMPVEGGAADTIARARIRAITLADGTVRDAGDPSWDRAFIPVPVPGFRHSIVRIAGYCSFHKQQSPLFDEEQRSLDLTQLGMTADPLLLSRHAFKLFVDNWSWGIDADLMLPALGRGGSPGFSFRGVKFGIRGRYGYEILGTFLYSQSRGGIPLERRYTARYLDYSFLGAGPVLDIIFGPQNNHYNLIIQAFLIYGGILHGRLRPNASLRDAGILVSAIDYRMDAGGYTLRWGLGPHICLNRWLPIMLGMNITMAFTRLRLPRPVLSYWSGRTRPYIINDIGMEITLGIHL